MLSPRDHRKIAHRRRSGVSIRQQHARDFGGRNRFAEQKSLKFIALEAPQNLQLRYGFDSLRDDLQIQRMPQRDDGLDDRDVVRIFGYVSHERTVDFHAIDREALQIGERRMSRSEIVDRQGDPVILDLLEQLQRLARTRHDDALGNFKFQQLRIAARLLQYLIQIVDQPRIGKLLGRQVDG